MEKITKALDGMWQWLKNDSAPLAVREGRTVSTPPGVCLPSIVIPTIDFSPSMENTDYDPTRLLGAQMALNRFLEKLGSTQPEALAGLVQFHGQARALIHPGPLQNVVTKVNTSIRWVSSDSGTNIGDGLNVAAREFNRFPKPSKKQIILLTDGGSNVGEDPINVATTIKEAGIQLDIIGIGGSPDDINEPDLKEMASVVDGELRYWFIKSVSGLMRRFEALALREIK